MNLNRELAEKIVIKTMNVLGKNINIMNSQGIIIGSGDRKRLNTFHEIAAKVIKQKSSIIIKKDKIDEYQGVKAGINLPIFFNKEIIGVVGITGKVEDVSGYGKIVKNMVELILHQEFLIHEIEIDNRAKENFYQQILNNDIQAQNLLEERLKLFDIKKDLKRVVFVFKFGNFNGKLLTKTIKHLNNLSFISKDDIFMIRGDKLVLVKTVNYQSSDFQQQKIIKVAENLKFQIKKIINDVKIGIGTIVDNINELYISYRDARFALEVGEKLYNEEHQNIFSIENLGFNYILPFIEDYHAENFLKNIFKQPDYKKYFAESNLGEIIEALVENNLNISQAAESLYIHRNTLLYQINKIETQTGYDLKDASELFKLLLAYHLYLFEQ